MNPNKITELLCRSYNILERCRGQLSILRPDWVTDLDSISVLMTDIRNELKSETAVGSVSREIQ